MIKKAAIVLVLILISAKYAFADINCNAVRTQSNTVPLSATMTTGNDLPIGSEIYRLTVASEGFGINCNSGFNGIPLIFSVSSEPSSPISVAGSAYSGSVVYPTNMAGVGAVVWYSGHAFTMSSPYTQTTLNYNPGAGVSSTLSFARSVDISFIKTGEISGGFVNGSSLPTVILYSPSVPGYSGLPATYWTLKFSGVIGITSGTCTTPNVNVNLGSHDLRTTFTGKGSTSEWVDSSIILEDCPAFLGNYPYSNPQKTTTTTTSSGASTPTGTPTSNKLVLSLTASTGVIDGTNGVVALSNEDGQASATGIGVQIGYNSTTNPTLWNFSNTWSYNIPNNGSPSITLPLAARYYQTSDVVTPGTANSSVIFTISYQ